MAFLFSIAAMRLEQLFELLSAYPNSTHSASPPKVEGTKGEAMGETSRRKQWWLYKAHGQRKGPWVQGDALAPVGTASELLMP
ncbi:MULTISPECIES: hypothetical protein [Cobetia]|uniref:hypothetical protein n=1 Tax=Cobetia TaxID=204286 RepID=UPI000986206A|nr:MULTISPECIES: hypothetical protein [Cobetia]MDA5563558.1 hypothetical protein [Cobetia sp. MMG027]POR08215.1 hypothetical protein BOH68_00785 [Cobetia sp. MM1IDA2H-1]